MPDIYKTNICEISFSCEISTNSHATLATHQNFAQLICNIANKIFFYYVIFVCA